jgi:RNA polymerase sigma-70 factor (ECF subfamily)
VHTDLTGWTILVNDSTLDSVIAEKSTFDGMSDQTRRFERRRQVTTTDTNPTVRFDSDLELVKRAQEGNADAFASLFHAHKARIYSVCLRMTNNTAEAEDLTQDAFLQVFRKLATFRGDSALSTWLYRIAVNTVLMHFRKKSLRQISLDEPYNQDAKQVRREYGSRDDRLTGSVDRIALARAIKELPDGYRTIFLLHEVEGYEHQEIAELLDCSVGNSKSQLHKAKLRIRELLGKAREEDEAKSSQRNRSKSSTRWENGAISLPVREAFVDSEFTATAA